MSCSAKSCKSSRSKTPGLRFFRFPRGDTDRCKIWARNAERLDLIDEKYRNQFISNSRLCEKHFEELCFPYDDKGRLSWHAIPTMFEGSSLHIPSFLEFHKAALKGTFWDAFDFEKFPEILLLKDTPMLGQKGEEDSKFTSLEKEFMRDSRHGKRVAVVSEIEDSIIHHRSKHIAQHNHPLVLKIEETTVIPSTSENQKKKIEKPSLNARFRNVSPFQVLPQQSLISQLQGQGIRNINVRVIHPSRGATVTLPPHMVRVNSSLGKPQKRKLTESVVETPVGKKSVADELRKSAVSEENEKLTGKENRTSHGEGDMTELATKGSLGSSENNKSAPGTIEDKSHAEEFFHGIAKSFVSENKEIFQSLDSIAYEVGSIGKDLKSTKKDSIKQPTSSSTPQDTSIGQSDGGLLSSHSEESAEDVPSSSLRNSGNQVEDSGRDISSVKGSPLSKDKPSKQSVESNSTIKTPNISSIVKSSLSKISKPVIVQVSTQSSSAVPSSSNQGVTLSKTAVSCKGTTKGKETKKSPLKLTVIHPTTVSPWYQSILPKGNLMEAAEDVLQPAGIVTSDSDGDIKEDDGDLDEETESAEGSEEDEEVDVEGIDEDTQVDKLALETKNADGTSKKGAGKKLIAQDHRYARSVQSTTQFRGKGSSNFDSDFKGNDTFAMLTPSLPTKPAAQREVHVLKEGYCYATSDGSSLADGTITLVRSAFHNIIVDTGSPWDAQKLKEGLARYSLTPGDINYVVCTHGHSDHIGNLNLFLSAVHIVGYDICSKDKYQDFPFMKGKNFIIEKGIEVIPTPGHTLSHVSLLVRGTKKGTIVVAGDLFECEDDLTHESLWRDNSEAPKTQESNRRFVLSLADYIIPGHGPMFKVPR